MILIRKANLPINVFLLICVFACSDDGDSNTISCCGEDSFVIETNNLPEDIEITPFNVITPNEDGLNDTFVIAGLAAYPDNSLKIFSNNTLIFESNDYHLDQVFGSNLRNDLFDQKIFTYELLVQNGSSFKAKGTICAIRSSTNTTESCNAFDLDDPLLN